MGKKIKLQKSKNSSFNQNLTLSSLKINPQLITKKRKIRKFKTIKPIKKNKPIEEKINSDNSDISSKISLIFNLFNSSNENSKSNSIFFNLNNSNNSLDLSESLSFGLDIPTKKPEWMKDETQNIPNVKKRFNQEILDYIDYITPKGWIYAKRELAFDKLKEMIKNYNTNFSVVLFGSFYQNISTIFSDIDVTIVNNSYNSYMELYELQNIRYFLIRNGYSNDLQLINARVPILKGTHAFTGVKLDISYNRLNGYEDSIIIKNIIEENNVIKQAIIILKIMLRRYYLNEPFSGGMSSFLLFHLVFFFYNECANKLKFKNDNISSFIILFLEYFGTKFDFDIYGISLYKKNKGVIFNKYGSYLMNNCDNICVESINERYVNIGQNCFKYEQVVNLFKKMFDKIKKEKEKNSLSILEKLGFPTKYFNI